MKAVEQHIHKYESVKTTHVILYDYRNVDNVVKEPGVAAKDTIKYRICKCGKTEAFDLERTIA